jgi:N-acetylneuraminic acid mutarotase
MHQDRPAVTALSDVRCVVAVALLCGLVLLAPAPARAAAPPPAPGTWSKTGSLPEVQRGERTATRLPDGRVLLAGGFDDIRGASAATDVFDPATGTWDAGGCLEDQRVSPTSVTLADGRVLIFGGACDQHPINTSEIYDPATGRFVPTGHTVGDGHQHTPAVLLHDGRVLAAGDGIATEVFDPAATDPATGLKGRWQPSGFIHLPLLFNSSTLTTLKDGRVLLAGGASGGPFAVDNTELWDPVTGLWTQTGKLNVSRYDAVATLLGDGRVLLAGGFHEDVGFANQTALSSSEIFDPATGTWTTTPGSMAVQRNFAGGTLLSSGKVLMVGGLDTSRNVEFSADLFDPATGTWTPTAGAPAQAHAFGTVTRLADGRVLAVGGDFGDPLASEIYDPGTDSWHAAAPPNFNRADSTANLLPDGKVLVRGGFPFPYNVSAGEVYDPTADHWTIVGPAGTARRSASATLLGNGKVLIAGGVAHFGGPTLASAELYDPASGISVDTGAMGTARSGQTATLLADGKVLVAGGLGNDGAPLGSAELYDPATGSWSAAGTLGARSQHTASLLPGGDVLVVGGRDAAGNALDSVERYSPASNDWSAAAALPGARTQHTATTLADGRVLVAGGHDSAGLPLRSAELWADGTWSAAHDLGTARFNQLAMLLPGGNVLVAGGTGPDGNLRTAELYNPASDSWTATESLTRPRSGMTGTLLADGRVLVTDGIVDPSAEIYDPAAPAKGHFLFTGTPQFMNYGSQTLMRNGKVLLVGGGDDGLRVEQFNPLSGRWSQVAPLAVPQPGHTAVLLADGKLLVAGSPTAAAEIYDPAANHWTVTGSMTAARSGAAGALLGDGRVLVVGGTGFLSSSGEVYDPASGAWTATVSSAIQRGQDGATTLTSLTSPGCADKCGQALLGGGVNNRTSALLELYDPATNSFHSPGRASTGRSNPTATRMLDGRVLFTSDGTAEIYDPAAPDTSATGPMPDRRGSYGAALVGDGTVLAAGGRIGGELEPDAPGELFDPATNRWRLTGNMRDPRQGAQLTSLGTGPFSVCGENCGKVLITGGGRFNDQVQTIPVTSAELFTPQPRVTGVDVAQGPVSGGTLVTIKGTGLAAAARVTFGDTQAASFIPDENSPVTTLTVVAPAHVAGTVDIRVASAGGTSDTSAADRFTYTVAGGAAPSATATATATAPAAPASATPKATDKKAPTLGALHLSRTRFHRAAGTRISFTLSERATVTLSFARVLPCKTPRRGCVRLVKVSPALRITGRKGTNRLTFRGRLSARRSLSAGGYKITARATDAAGNHSRARTARFVLLR